MAETKKTYYYGRGRRKESTARVRLYTGKGESKINAKNIIDYFKKNEILITRVAEPLKLTGNNDKTYFEVIIEGGGLSGQADAIALGLSRALVTYDENLRTVLRKAGLLTRDQREKERKKFGLKRARKAPQFSKR
jgi:small subunit ribosomal protein S9